MVTLSLCMIGRNAEATVGRALISALPWCDELVFVDTGSTDGTVAVVEQVSADTGKPLTLLRWADEVNHPRWISNFAAARNYGWKHCTGEMILWLDCDDELMTIDGREGSPGGKALREFVEEHCRADLPKDKRIDSILARYDYGHDDYGYPVVVQARMRCARNGYFKWINRVHESLWPTRPGTRTDDPYNERFYVRHGAGHNREDSAQRNVWIYEQQQAAGEEMSPHDWRGMADSCRVLGRWKEAVKYADRALEGAIAADEGYLVLVRRGDSKRMLGLHEQALDDYQRAERLCPAYKAAYMATAELLLDTGRFEQALLWCDKIDMAKGDEKSMIFNPTAARAIPAKVRAFAFEALEEWKLALEQFNKLLAMFPGDPDLKAKAAAITEALRVGELYSAFEAVHDAQPEQHLRAMLLYAAPDELKHFPLISSAKRPPRPDGKRVVAIWCGRTTNLWDAESLLTGTGGSEESAIYMSRHLVQLGYHVEVYGCPHPRNIGYDADGVVWLPHHAWQDSSTADIFVAWRAPQAISLASNCEQRWLWLQDMPVSEWYTAEFCSQLDGILCISEFQAGKLGEWGMDKAIITANGVEISSCADGPNNSNEFIYASSPDRGLMELLKVWPVIRGALPGSKLHVFYGFRDIYLKAAARTPGKLDLKEKIEDMLRQPGIAVHGMVGEQQLHQIFAQCGFWLYPTSFEEAFCITAAKAQCMGAIPITSRHLESSLPEVCGTFDMGPPPRTHKIDSDMEWLTEWTQAVLEAAQMRDLSGLRKEMKAWARQTYDWKAVALQWHRLFSGAHSSASLVECRAEVSDRAKLSPAASSAT